MFYTAALLAVCMPTENVSTVEYEKCNPQKIIIVQYRESDAHHAEVLKAILVFKQVG